MKADAAAAPHRPDRSLAERIFGRWWRRQSLTHQDRYATLAPLMAVLLFLAVIVATFWYLRNEELERQQEAVKRDTEVTQQQIRLRLIESHEQLVRMAREITTRTLDRHGFLVQASSFTRDRPETTNLLWLDARRRPVASWSGANFPPETGISGIDTPASLPVAGSGLEPEAIFKRGRASRQITYSHPFLDSFGDPVIQVLVPLLEGTAFTGAVVAEFSVDRLLRYQVPAEVSRRHTISLVDTSGKILASTAMPMGDKAATRRPSIVSELPIAPADIGILVRGEGFRTSIGLVGNTLFWMVMALSALTVWMLLGTWRHTRRRTQMQAALVQETNFRRAMENSMLTGMRALDMEGRITYVNPAFCAMTGFSEGDLIGALPPFPHWPPDRREENARLLVQELQGRSPAGGAEVKVARKDGSVFDARMYVSPLIDRKGQQSGWMTSMTNITEAKRIRDQLSASHERFTTVLEGLDTAVSVVSVQQGELLFANRSYRLWFGADAHGHSLLSGAATASRPMPLDGSGADDEAVDVFGGLATQELTAAGSDAREVYVESTDQWFDVRARYLQWTDGRLAQMLIAADVSQRRRAEAQAEMQAEKAQVTSRLVTMGEMASSVAHELNQPLTAISNYCNGMVTRVENDAIDKGDLIAALKKTSRQAERAGQIIHRIRAFVKRSEPQRQRAYAHAIVEDAVELAGIELRRRNVAIQTHVAQRLPPLLVDPILIEQVVLNLLKNAAEAIDEAHLPAARRRIELHVVPKHTDEEGDVVEFTISDRGPGLREDVLARMYEAFFSTKADGLGIGLSLCRSIIESHRGRIRGVNLYNDSVAVGCCFTFTLPVEPSRLEPSTAPSTAASA